MRLRVLLISALFAATACTPSNLMAMIGLTTPAQLSGPSKNSKSPKPSASPKASSSPKASTSPAATTSPSASASPSASPSASASPAASASPSTAPVAGQFTLKIDGVALPLQKVRRSPLAATIIDFGATDGEYIKDPTLLAVRFTTYLKTGLFSNDFTRADVQRVQFKVMGTDKKINMTRDFNPIDDVTADEVSVSRTGDKVTFHLKAKVEGLGAAAGGSLVEFDAVVNGADIAVKPTTP